jgi:hypothetical protein
VGDIRVFFDVTETPVQVLATKVFREVVGNGLAIVLAGVAIGELLTAALTGVAIDISHGSSYNGLLRTT